MSSLMDSLGNAIPPDLTSALAQRYDLFSDAVHFSLQASAAAVFTAIASRTKDIPFVSSIYDLLTGSDPASVPTATQTSDPGVVARFLDILFGSHLEQVTAEIARTSNISNAAADASLKAVAPLVMGILSDRITGGGLTLASFGKTLESQLPQLKGFLPAGFQVPGVSGLIIADDPRASVPRAPSRAIEPSRYGAGWLWPVLISGVILISALIWYFSREAPPAMANSDIVTQTPAAQAPLVEAQAAPPKADPAVAGFSEHKLPDGVELNVPDNGIEAKLILFIEDSARPIDDHTWFDFDRLLFATASDKLEPSSNEQLENVAAILKAYPNVHLRIGGYTDNTGNSEANLRLSQNRASNVRYALIKLGTSPDRLDARGYGEQHPVADNSSEAGRAQNRRISVRVLQK